MLYQLSYLGTRSRCKEEALLQNWSGKIKVPTTSIGGFYSVAVFCEAPGRAWGIQDEDTCAPIRRLYGFNEKTVGMSRLGLAEREGFEPSVEVLAPTTV